MESLPPQLVAMIVERAISYLPTVAGWMTSVRWTVAASTVSKKFHRGLRCDAPWTRLLLLSASLQHIPWSPPLKHILEKDLASLGISPFYLLRGLFVAIIDFGRATAEQKAFAKEWERIHGVVCSYDWEEGPGHPAGNGSWKPFDEEIKRRLHGEISLLRCVPIPTGGLDNALRAYRMWQHLRQRNPEALILPPQDAYWVEQCHIMHTALWWKERTFHESRLYLPLVESLAAAKLASNTNQLWKSTFGMNLFPDSDLDHVIHRLWTVEHDLNAPQPEGVGPSGCTEFQLMPAFLKCDAPLMDTALALDGECSLTVDDLLVFKNSCEKFNFMKCDMVQYASAYISSYERFVHLARMCPSLSLAPTPTMDFVWHVHQMDPVRYRKEITSLCGSLLLHRLDSDDSEHPSPPSDEMQRLWRQHFGGVDLNTDHEFDRDEIPL